MQPSLIVPPSGLKPNLFNLRHQKEKVVIVMGATGTGKSRLSIDLATRFSAEIINSDKMQVYEGLDVVTNKITNEEQRGVPHHLLGILKKPNADFTVTDFCDKASITVESILSHNRLPIIVGGSNSYIEHLIDDYNYKLFRSKYDCCFLWVDVSMPVLNSFVSDRVDAMLLNGMVDEVRNIFDPNANYSKGIRRAIGVPEFDKYLRNEQFLDEKSRAGLLQEAIKQMKENTSKLACRQLGKIQRLRNIKGWNLHRLDATEVFRKRGKEADLAWENLVAGPSTEIVGQFLCNVSAPADVAPVTGTKLWYSNSCPMRIMPPQHIY
ncbi:hypothetical protein FNV43_RR23415 [Rhamnella rubrinervis]|uniref:adenylate dimethylallyltransferase (ADP/ATP-dependent) n=1 Tax=Rhamnella rubrinervis TaxID=2594499 RepID=A0A8K0DXW3_9ROSA|nr:hypothetical protein FNV43_RR23415 [Rhamnella rubrinervis]